MINYTMAREHFVDMGEQVHKHIYDLNLAWGQFLDFYSDLNNARKAHEDDFADRQYIGEELQEPDEQPLSNDDLIDNWDDNDDNLNSKEVNKDFYEAFDDGFDEIKNNRSGSIAGGRPSMQPADTSNQSQNMLSELQREIREEEAGAKAKPAAIEEEKKESAAE